MGLKDYLPNFKDALNSFYDEKIKNNFEAKNTEYKELFEKHLQHWHNTQKALILIALGIFLLLAIAYFWPNS